jgi:hypothetical protein
MQRVLVVGVYAGGGEQRWREVEQRHGLRQVRTCPRHGAHV